MLFRFGSVSEFLGVISIGFYKTSDFLGFGGGLTGWDCWVILLNLPANCFTDILG